RLAPLGRDEPARPTSAAMQPDDSQLEVERQRLAGALAASPDGVIVVDSSGEEVLRNAAAERYRDARHADALAKDVIAQLLAQALLGVASERELSLFGPPREVVLVRAEPLRQAEGSLVGAVAFVHDIS